MTVETAAKTISLILAPVVMLSACGILVSAMLQHYAAINDRVRALSQERLAFVAGRDSGPRERLTEIDHQLPELLHRHELVRNAILTVYGAVVVFVVSMFVIAGAALSSSGALATAALLVFLGGTAVLLVGLVYFALDIRISHEALQYEARRVATLVPPTAPGPAE
jgi:Protein of unknown function (DUF2721)